MKMDTVYIMILLISPVLTSMLPDLPAVSMRTDRQGKHNLSQTLYGYFTTNEDRFVLQYKKPPSTFTIQLYTPIGNLTGDFVLLSSSESKVAKVIEGSILVAQCFSNVTENSTELVEELNEEKQNATDFCYDITFDAASMWLGYSKLKLQLLTGNSQNETREVQGSVMLISIRSPTMMDHIFQHLIRILMGMATLGMGCEFDYKSVLGHLKRPKAPIIALLSQFTFMPLLAYLIVYIMKYKGGEAIGIFLAGIAPGGGPSNMYTKLLNGDMSASVTMTTLSTLASMGFIPFWLYTLGSHLPMRGDLQLEIPFLTILSILAVIIVPLLCGILIKWKLPKLADKITKVLKPFFVLVILTLTVTGIYSMFYIFECITVSHVLSGFILPFGGYFLGGLMAWISRCEWKMIKTISIETGQQNAALPLLIVQSALSTPDSDIAMVPLLTVVLITVLSLSTVVTPAYLIYSKFCAKQREEVDDQQEKAELDECEAMYNKNNNASSRESLRDPPDNQELIESATQTQRLKRSQSLLGEEVELSLLYLTDKRAEPHSLYAADLWFY